MALQNSKKGGDKWLVDAITFSIGLPLVGFCFYFYVILHIYWVV